MVNMYRLDESGTAGVGMISNSSVQMHHPHNDNPHNVIHMHESTQQRQQNHECNNERHHECNIERHHHDLERHHQDHERHSHERHHNRPRDPLRTIETSSIFPSHPLDQRLKDHRCNSSPHDPMSHYQLTKQQNLKVLAFHEKFRFGERSILRKAASSPEKDDLRNEHVLFQMVATNNIASVVLLLQDLHSEPTDIVGTAACRHDLLLHRSVRCGWMDMTECLLSCMVSDINVPKRDGATALFIAAQEGHCDLVRMLIARGADLNLADEDGISPLYIASYQGHSDVVDLLLASGANPNQLGKDQTSPLYIASQEGYANIVHMLASSGANVNASDKDGTTSLLMASQEGRIAAVAVLLAFGADVTVATSRGVQPIHSAAQNGHVKIFQMLTAYGADVHSFTQSGTNAVRLAIDFQHQPIVNWIEASASWDPLRMCAEAGLYWVAQNLLHSGHADIHMRGVDKILALRAAGQNASFADPCSITKSLFQRATRNWSINSHRLYGPAFRSKIRLIMLIKQRLNNNGHRHPCHPPVPEEMWLSVLGYLSRTNDTHTADGNGAVDSKKHDGTCPMLIGF